MEPKSSSPYSQQPATCPYPKPADSSPHSTILLIHQPFQHHPTTYAYVFQHAFLLDVSPPKCGICSSSHLYVPHALPISSASIWPPEYHVVRNADFEAAHCDIFNSPKAPNPLSPNILNSLSPCSSVNAADQSRCMRHNTQLRSSVCVSLCTGAEKAGKRKILDLMAAGIACTYAVIKFFIQNCVCLA